MNDVIIPGISKVMAFTKNEDEKDIMERIIQDFALLDEKNPLLVDRILDQLRESPLAPQAPSIRGNSTLLASAEEPQNEFAELLIERWRSRVSTQLNLSQLSGQN